MLYKLLVYVGSFPLPAVNIPDICICCDWYPGISADKIGGRLHKSLNDKQDLFFQKYRIKVDQ